LSRESAPDKHSVRIPAFSAGALPIKISRFTSGEQVFQQEARSGDGIEVGGRRCRIPGCTFFAPQDIAFPDRQWYPCAIENR
jgi:hypothetical protein